MPPAVPSAAPEAAPIPAPLPPPIAAPRPAPSTVPITAPPSAWLLALSAWPATCWLAKFSHRAWSCWNSSKGLLGAGMTAMVGPIGGAAQALNVNTAAKPHAVVLREFFTAKPPDGFSSLRLGRNLTPAGVASGDVRVIALRIVAVVPGAGLGRDRGRRGRRRRVNRRRVIDRRRGIDHRRRRVIGVIGIAAAA